MNRRDVVGTDSNLQTCASGTTLKGVDVSNYQGAIDWGSAAASGISFGFAKATEGVSLVDSTFAANWSGMRSAGIVRGAYHFFHPSDDAKAQASFVVSTVGSLEANDLPIVLDFEVLDGVSEATAVADAVVFLDAVSSATGKKAILYMSTDFLSGSYSALQQFPLWVADYGPACPGVPGGWSSWNFWQYGDNGGVSGISGGTDVDEFNGTLAALQAFAQGSGVPDAGTTAPAPDAGSISTTCTLGGHSYPSNTCTETQQCDDGSWVARSADPLSCASGVLPDDACLDDSGKTMEQDSCTSTLQCSDGVWVDRMSDPAACLGSTATSCTLGGKTYAQNTCTETLQCDSGEWIARSKDTSSCTPGIEAQGACLTDTGAVDAQNTCTSTLQCDDGVWVNRSTDPQSCL